MFARIGPIEIAIISGGDDDEFGPPTGGGLLLESDTAGTAFLLLENDSFLLLEG
jgi:hypothetical protein